MLRMVGVCIDLKGRANGTFSWIGYGWERGSQEQLWDFWSATKRMELSFPEMGKTASEAGVERKISFGQVEFEMPIRHPHGDSNKHHGETQSRDVR